VAPGSLIAGRFELLDRLGAGGMGTVFKARDRRLDETVAVKVLRLGRDAHSLERFHSEVRLARKVKHRNVCGVYEYGEDGDVVFCAMELVSGRNLRQLLSEAPLPRAWAYKIALAVAAGLQAIHEAGVIHRDVKSANVMIDAKGEIRLVDFGIAKRHRPRGEETPGLTGELHIVGSPEYMSPEQVCGLPLDPRSDVYSFGIVLFEMFAGRVPFQGKTAMAVMAKQVEEAPPLEGSVADLLPAELLPVLRRALAKDPGMRYPSVSQLAHALRDAQEAHARATTDDVTPEGVESGPSRPLWEQITATRHRDWSARRLAPAAIAALATLAAAAIAFLARNQPSTESPARSRPPASAATAAPAPLPSSVTPTTEVVPVGTPAPAVAGPRTFRSPNPRGDVRAPAVGRPLPASSPTPTPTPTPTETAEALATPPDQASAGRGTTAEPASHVSSGTVSVPPTRATAPPPRRGDTLSADDPEVIPARCLSCEVAYSPQAERLRVEGDVVLALVVDEEGRVADARILRSDDRLLEAPALRSVMRWRYHPATRGGVAGRMRLQVTVRFRL
jgi:serine/threonine-protein kinase